MCSPRALAAYVSVNKCFEEQGKSCPVYPKSEYESVLSKSFVGLAFVRPFSVSSYFFPSINILWYYLNILCRIKKMFYGFLRDFIYALETDGKQSTTIA